MAQHTTTDSTICAGIIKMQHLNGQRFENVLHFAKTGVGADMDTLQTALQALIAGTWRDCLSYTVNMRQIAVENVLTGTQVLHDYGTLVGASSSGPAPFALATVMSLRTGQKQRYRNGRFYFSGFPKSWIDGDEYGGPTSGTFDALLTDMAARFLGLTPSSTWNLVVYTKGKAPFGTGGLGWPAGAMDVDVIRWNRVFGTQRRRIPGHGS